MSSPLERPKPPERGVPPHRGREPTYADAPRIPAPAVEGARVPVASLLVAPCNRIEIEVGPGRGGFLLERLTAVPDVGMIGLEVRRKWAQIVDDRLARRGLGPRGRVFAEDAKLALPVLGPDRSVAAFFVHFPDPWWKRRHHRRLLLDVRVLDEMARLLVPGGDLFLQTDVEERAASYEALVEAHPGFVTAGQVPGSARLDENPYGARSHRERRAIADVLPVFRLRFQRALEP